MTVSVEHPTPCTPPLRMHAAPPDLMRRAMDATRPRRPDGRWWAAAVVLLAVGATSGWLLRGTLAPAAARVEGAPDDIAVRLVFHAPDARAVSVAGSFNGWDPQATPLVRGEHGAFFAIVPLPPGRHEYMFVVDGAWVADPAAPLTRPDDFGDRNGILDV